MHTSTLVVLPAGRHSLIVDHMIYTHTIYICKSFIHFLVQKLSENNEEEVEYDNAPIHRKLNSIISLFPYICKYLNYTNKSLLNITII
jgi:hypothetical protein